MRLSGMGKITQPLRVGGDRSARQRAYRQSPGDSRGVRLSESTRYAMRLGENIRWCHTDCAGEFGRFRGALDRSGFPARYLCRRRLNAQTEAGPDATLS